MLEHDPGVGRRGGPRRARGASPAAPRISQLFLLLRGARTGQVGQRHGVAVPPRRLGAPGPRAPRRGGEASDAQGVRGSRCRPGARDASPGGGDRGRARRGRRRGPGPGGRVGGGLRLQRDPRTAARPPSLVSPASEEIAAARRRRSARGKRTTLRFENFLFYFILFFNKKFKNKNKKNFEFRLGRSARDGDSLARQADHRPGRAAEPSACGRPAGGGRWWPQTGQSPLWLGRAGARRQRERCWPQSRQSPLLGSAGARRQRERYWPQSRQSPLLGSAGARRQRERCWPQSRQSPLLGSAGARRQRERCWPPGGAERVAAAGCGAWASSHARAGRAAGARLGRGRAEAASAAGGAGRQARRRRAAGAGCGRLWRRVADHSPLAGRRATAPARPARWARRHRWPTRAPRAG